jgi:hypothetical protein
VKWGTGGKCQIAIKLQEIDNVNGGKFFLEKLKMDF